MSNMKAKELLRIGAALLAGLLGGQIHLSSVRAEPASGSVVRANRFELTDKSGKTLAYWDSKGGRSPCLHFLDGSGREAAALGLQPEGTPFLDMMGADSKIRMTLRLEGAEGRPILVMSDEKWEGRLMLGFMQPDAPSPTWDDWGLLLRAPQRRAAVASLGMMHDAATNGFSGRVTLLGRDGGLWTAPDSTKADRR